jgi:hypothetical protein
MVKQLQSKQGGIVSPLSDCIRNGKGGSLMPFLTPLICFSRGVDVVSDRYALRSTVYDIANQNQIVPGLCTVWPVHLLVPALPLCASMPAFAYKFLQCLLMSMLEKSSRKNEETIAP